MGMAAKGDHVMSCTWESKSTWNPYNDSVSIQGLLFIALQLLISNICSRLFNIRCVSILNVKCSHPAIKCSPTIHLPSTWRCCSQAACGFTISYIWCSNVQMFNVHIQLNVHWQHWQFIRQAHGALACIHWHHNVQCLLQYIDNVKYISSDVQMFNDYI